MLIGEVGMVTLPRNRSNKCMLPRRISTRIENEAKKTTKDRCQFIRELLYLKIPTFQEWRKYRWFVIEGALFWYQAMCFGLQLLIKCWSFILGSCKRHSSSLVLQQMACDCSGAPLLDPMLR